jgi:hypothetical protein
MVENAILKRREGNPYATLEIVEFSYILESGKPPICLLVGMFFEMGITFNEDKKEFVATVMRLPSYFPIPKTTVDRLVVLAKKRPQFTGKKMFQFAEKLLKDEFDEYMTLSKNVWEF